MAIDSQMQTTAAGTRPVRPGATGNPTTSAAASGQTADAFSGSAVAVDLSPAGQLIAGLLPGQSSGNADLDGFMQILQQQIRSQGTDAAVLGELPQDASADRVQLAKQAANHLLVSFYGADSRFADASTQDPFANLDSSSLTRIAGDDSGTFTPAERQLAYFEGAQRGTEATSVASLGLSPAVAGQAPWNWVPAAAEEVGILGTLSPGAPSWQPGQLNAQIIDGIDPAGVAAAAAQEVAALSAPTFSVSTDAEGTPQWTTQPADGQDAAANTLLDGRIIAQMTGTTTAPALSLYRQIAAYGG